MKKEDLTVPAIFAGGDRNDPWNCLYRTADLLWDCL